MSEEDAADTTKLVNNPTDIDTNNDQPRNENENEPQIEDNNNDSDSDNNDENGSNSAPNVNKIASASYSAVEMTSNDNDDDDGQTTTMDTKHADKNESLSFTEAVSSVFLSFWPLGLVAFGGPTAHIAILHERFVERKKWLSDEIFLELLAVGQGLPGPTSTQMVISCGAYKAGIIGGLLSFLCWNLPSFIILTLSGLGVSQFINGDPYWMKGLPPAAISLVFVAAYKLSSKVIDSSLKIFLCTISTVCVLLLVGDDRISAKQQAIAYPILIFSGGIFTIIDSKISPKRSALYDKIREKSHKERIITTLPYMNKYTSMILCIIWIVILLTFVSLRSSGSICTSEQTCIGYLFESMFRIGSIIYGGGQVVLPMLLSEVTDPGWCTASEFWTGFAIVQALPGPLFNFSAYLGAVSFGISGAFIAWLGLFGPGLLLIFAFLPLWNYIHSIESFRIFLQGVNATAIGLVISACIILWNGAVNNYASSCVAIITAANVALFNVPAPIAIIIGGIIGWLFSDQVIGVAQTDFCQSFADDYATQICG